MAITKTDNKMIGNGDFKNTGPLRAKKKFYFANEHVAVEADNLDEAKRKLKKKLRTK